MVWGSVLELKLGILKLDVLEGKLGAWKVGKAMHAWMATRKFDINQNIKIWRIYN